MKSAPVWTLKPAIPRAHAGAGCVFRLISAAVLFLCIPQGVSIAHCYQNAPLPALRFDLMGLPSPELMARLIIVESGGNPQAISKAGAKGLTQLMPALVKSLHGNPNELFNAEYSIDKGARWLGILIARYGVDGGLRAWNCGETRRHLWYTAPVNEFVRRIVG